MKNLHNLYNQVKQNKISKEEAINMLKNIRKNNKETSKFNGNGSIKANNLFNELDLLELVKSTVFLIVFNLLKIKNKEDLDVNVVLNEYGFESITLTKLANLINEDFGLDIMPTLFFEYNTIQTIAEYIVKEHVEICKKRFDTHEDTPNSNERKSEKSNDSKIVSKKSNKKSGKHSFDKNSYKKIENNLPVQNQDKDEPIAIIGMSGRFPESDDLELFWDNLKEGKDCISEIPKSRWDWKEYYGDPHYEDNKTNIKWGGFINGVDEFDPLFFGISPREAELMDPQQRLLMIYVWKAIEDAGYSAKSLSGSDTSIFVGAANSGYSNLAASSGVPLQGYSSTGSLPSVGPNRMSYFLNWHGPSEPIETACSSSLVAIHRAIGVIRSGQSQMSVVGGVNTILSPDAHISFSKANMLSEDGKCKTFSKDANGYVRGEGIGMLVLKKLSKAEEDGDHIYGVIKGSAENHGGKSNSLTAPNPKAQAELIKSACIQSGIDPSTITYIESHGTGTKLGDPIEINGLKSAFKGLYENAGKDIVSGTCGIGSVKTNIGHLELVAGIAGVMKVVLQLKHKTLVKTLHCNETNPFIKLNDSPFFLVKETQSWKALIDKDGDIIPRRAGVSSFGFGGVNAHVIIEEYMPNKELISERKSITNPSCLILLSAKNEERLYEQAKLLLESIKAGKVSNENLVDVAFTLQIGRDAMEERLGIISNSVVDLEFKLNSFLTYEEDIQDVYRGQIKDNEEKIKAYSNDESLRELLESSIENKINNKIPKLWVLGLSFDWNKLYKGKRPRRLSLPTYPFAKERYWVPIMKEKLIDKSKANRKIHPLLHQNISNIDELLFVTTFTGQEFFLKDHRVKGERFLPGVAYLEMTRVALDQVLKNTKNYSGNFKLHTITWVSPIILKEVEKEIFIKLFLDDEKNISYEIYSKPKNSTGKTKVHSFGMATLEDNCTSVEERVNISVLQSQCNQHIFSSEECYQFFEELGISYGPAHQGLKQILVGKEQILVKLAMPVSQTEAMNEYKLHPSIMDAALQGAIGFSLQTKESLGADFRKNTALPFALQELEIFHSSTAVEWAYIRPSDSSTSGDTVNIYDIELYDAQGMICVRMKGFSSRILSTSFNELESNITHLKEEGKNVIEVTDNYQDNTLEYEEKTLSHIVDLQLFNLKENKLDNIKGIVDSINEKMEMVLVKLLFCQLRALGIFSEHNTSLATIKVKSGIIDIYHPWLKESLELLKRHNFIKEVNNQYSLKISGAIDLESCWEEWKNNKIKWSDNNTLIAQANLVEDTLMELPNILRGKIRSTEVIFPDSSMKGVEELYKNNIVPDFFNEVLADILLLYIKRRREQNPNVKLRILEVGAGTGGTSHKIFDKIKPYKDQVEEYCYTDISRAFLFHGEKEYGSDNPYLTYKLFNIEEPLINQNFDPDTFDVVIATNVFHATKNINTTIKNAKKLLHKNGVILINEIIKNNAFSHLTFGLLEGWWLYEDTNKRIPGCPGIFPATWSQILDSEGFESVYFPAEKAHSLGQSVIVAESNGIITEAQIELNPLAENIHADDLLSPSTERLAEDVEEKVTVYIKKMICNVLKINYEKIDISMPFEKYGLDSLLIIELTSELRKKLKSIPSTLFFEVQTIKGLVDKLIKDRKEELIDVLGLAKSVKQVKKSNKSTTKESSIVDSTNESTVETQQYDVASKQLHVKDVAIIGLSGKYPKSDNLNMFWNHLKNGENCISEIPKERWDWEVFYDDKKGKKDKIYSTWGGFIEGIDEFDPLFFNISPAEAEKMDPQERLFLQTAYHAIEDAGYTPVNLSKSKKVGVFTGVMNGNYPTGANFWSLSNRVSYLLDFQGPSMAVDTACSSSLTAIHLALESLYMNTSECAIAGGVNLIVDPSHYMRLCSAGMLSSTNECKSFGDNADGFIDGEGVGAIVLKPLDKAIIDGDHIYGIIKGSSVNAGGKTNGYTVPNPIAQGKLISEAYLRSGINPLKVSYIEAHGTGTKLGDPIEIAGLNEAFKEYTSDNNFCALGSVKSNIGHSESAAGIAGLTKVLLQLKHKQIAPSIHSSKSNPQIDFNNSPFRLQQKLTEWERPIIKEGEKSIEYPRIAGISSFGAGGANAHLVVQEYVTSKQPIVNIELKSFLILLSANSKECLIEQAKRLLQFIENESLLDEQLAQMAYTLQLGRVALTERLAFEVESIEMLTNRLQSFIYGEHNLEGVYCGSTASNQVTSFFTHDEDLQNALGSWIIKEKYAKILDLWVRGLNFDWAKIYGNKKLLKMSLPGYPFAKEKYWFEKAEIKLDIQTNANSSISQKSNYLHPLVHTNTSDFSGIRFSTKIYENDFFVRDHLVQGKKVFPGVAYLEMVSASIEQSHNQTELENKIIRLNNVVWTRPLIVEGIPTDINIKLNKYSDKPISYTIYSGDESLTHFQGKAEVISRKGEHQNISILKNICNDKVISAKECYATFDTAGIAYGKTFRAIESLYIGGNSVLAKLKISDNLSTNFTDYKLHPSLIDAAFQATIALSDVTNNDDSRTYLPYSIEKVDIINSCSTNMWAYIQNSPNNSSDRRIQKFDIKIFDENGMLCVDINRISFRELGNKPDKGKSTHNISTINNKESNDRFPAHTLELLWERFEPIIETSLPRSSDNVIVISDSEEVFTWMQKTYKKAKQLSLSASDKIEEITLKIKQLKEVDHIIWSVSEEACSAIGDSSIMAAQQHGVILCFRTIKALLSLGYGSKKLGWTVLTTNTQPINGTEVIYSSHSGLFGLLGSMAKEYSNWKVKVIDLDKHIENYMNKSEGQQFLKRLSTIPSNSKGDAYVYRNQNWYRQILTKNRGTSGKQTKYRQNGVYLAIGGAGGIGEVWTEYMIKNYNAQVIWIGRRSIDGVIQDKIKRLSKFGTTPHYISADATSKSDMNSAYEEIKKRYGVIHGILHTAIVLEDKGLASMNENQFLKAFSCKVDVSVQIASVFCNESLDFILFFSSAQSYAKLPGQSNYAAGCTFKDVFAHQLRQEFSCDVKVINWGYWGSVGIVASLEYRKRMAKFGIGSIEADEGMEALEALLSGSTDQLVFLKMDNVSSLGDIYRDPNKVNQLEQVENVDKQALVIENYNNVPVGKDRKEQRDIREQATEYLRGLVSSVLKVKDLDVNKGLDTYGLDSILVLSINNELEKHFEDLSNTLFFEYSTILDLTGYFVENHSEELLELFCEKKVLEKKVQDNEEHSEIKSKSGFEKNKIEYHTNLSANQSIDEQTGIREQTTGYLRGLVSSVLKVKNLDINKSLDTYGLDSILVLSINNELEKHFEDLSNTLFFEYSTIFDLTDYFIDNHESELGILLGDKKELNKPILNAEEQCESEIKLGFVEDNFFEKINQKETLKENYSIDELMNLSSDSDIIHHKATTPKTGKDKSSQKNENLGYTVIHQDELNNNTELAQLIAKIDKKYPPMGYEGILFPYFLISFQKGKYLRMIIDEKQKLVIPYINTDQILHEHLLDFAKTKGLRPLVVDMYHEFMDTPDNVLIPMGVMQDIDVESFTLNGGKKQKLRNMIQKFKKSGTVRVEELFGTPESKLFEQMKRLMIKWSENKKNVIKHSLICMENLLKGELPHGQRAFMIFHSEELCCLIVVEEDGEGQYYVMDQEFYDSNTAPTGHMEYGIIKIIEKLKGEGAKIFSLGITWYPFAFENDTRKDTGGWEWMIEQNSRKTMLSTIIDQGKSNYQFKKKFGIRGEPVYAYLPKEAHFSLILNYWPVFYQNSLTISQLKVAMKGIEKPCNESKTKNIAVHVESEKTEVIKQEGSLAKPEEKWQELSREVRESIINKPDGLINLHYSESPLDLITDTWFSKKYSYVKERTAYLESKPETISLEVIKEVFPFEEIILTTQGRYAEELFYTSIAKNKKKILSCIPWTSTLFAQLHNKFEVIELPDPDVFDLTSLNICRGEIDLEALKWIIEKQGDDIAMVCIEVLSNASGGHGVRPGFIRQLKKLLKANNLPLVIDASRLIRNAYVNKYHGSSYKTKDLWYVVQQTVKHADYIVTSLSKDFGIPYGGLIGTNDSVLADKIRKLQEEKSYNISKEMEHVIFQGFTEKDVIIKLNMQQLEFSKRLSDALVKINVPILQPAYGHALVIDVSEMVDGVNNKEKKQGFLNHLFLETGIRGGVHQVGQQKNNLLDQCIRLAIPLGLSKSHQDLILNKLKGYFLSRIQDQKIVNSMVMSEMNS